MNLADAIERKVLVRALAYARDHKLFHEARDRSVLDKLIEKAKDVNPQKPRKPRERKSPVCMCGHREEVHRGALMSHAGPCQVLGCSCVSFREKGAEQRQKG